MAIDDLIETRQFQEGLQDIRRPEVLALHDLIQAVGMSFQGPVRDSLEERFQGRFGSEITGFFFEPLLRVLLAQPVIIG